MKAPHQFGLGRLPDFFVNVDLLFGDGDGNGDGDGDGDGYGDWRSAGMGRCQ